MAPINSSRNYGCKVQRRKRPDSRNNVGRKIRGHGRPITRKNADRNFMGRGSRLLLIRPNLLIRSLLIPAKTTGYFCSASKHRFLASDDRVDFLFFFVSTFRYRLRRDANRGCSVLSTKESRYISSRVRYFYLFSLILSLLGAITALHKMYMTSDWS